MYACGLRISEATTLEIGAVDRANQVLRIVGKGDKERLVPLPQPVLDELGRLWRRHHNRRWLFPNHRGDAPVNKRVLSDTFAAAAATAGIQRGVTPHALRHSYATRLIENGIDTRIVQICSERRHTAHEHLVEGRIYYRFHPRCGETVLIKRQLEHRGVVLVVILQPDSSLACIPLWMTHEAAAQYTLSEKPHFSVDILRSLRAEINALLGFLSPKSKAEEADNVAPIQRSPTNTNPR